MFSAGHLTSPMPSDQRFSQYADAEKAAIAGSVDDDVWAVWEDESGEVRAVVYQQIVYLP
jgi:hypothetical protein